MEIGEVVYCVNESCYAEHLTKRNAYEVHRIDGDNLRVKSKRGRLVWLSKYLFSTLCPPGITLINIDDVIEDSLNDCVEVTITFSDGTKRWGTFTTPNFLSNLLSSNDYVIGEGLIFVNYLDVENIEKTIHEMDRLNELIEQTQPLE